MKRLSWKYIAGLIDGEGCIDVVFNKSSSKAQTTTLIPRVRVTFVNSCLFVLETLQTNHGGWINSRHFDNPKWQDPSTWTLQGKQFRAFMQNIVNHLEIKKEQAKLAIWIQDNLRHKGMQQAEDVKQCARKELSAMKADPQRLSEAAILRIVNTQGFHGHWSSKASCCKNCGTTDRKHEAHGLCEACYKKSRYHEKKN